jgi:DNA-binding transcriptional regulator YiaG
VLIIKQHHALARLESQMRNIPLRSGHQIAAARGLAGMKQKELAQAGGWSERGVRGWEAAEGIPTSHVPHLLALVDIFRAVGVEFTAQPLGVRLIERHRKR